MIDAGEIGHAQACAVLDALPDLVFRLDSRGRHLGFHAGRPEDLHANASEILGRTVAELMPPEVTALYETHIPQALGGTPQAFEYSIVDKDLERRHFEARMVRYSETEVVVIVRNVTDRKVLERRLMQVEKLDAIGQLATGVAHDFNNQINVIMGYSALLEDFLDDPTARTWNEEVRQAAARSERLTRQLLTFARRVEHDRAPMDLHDSIRDVAGLLERTLGRRIQLQLELAPEPMVILGDAAHLETAMLNLALNARDAMPQGGRITFSTRALADPPFVELRVADTGTGMAPEQLRRIFEPFFTTKPQGTGLGLSMVHGTVTGHGGTIQVESEPGRGTVCILRLPLLDGTQLVQQRDQPHEIPLSSRRIVAVDDEPGVLRLVEHLLGRLGHSVVSFTTGTAALAYLKDHHDEVDLVVLDVDLPGTDGLDVRRELGQLAPEVPVLLSSGYGAGAVIDALEGPGTTEFLPKPFTVRDLRRALASVLR